MTRAGALRAAGHVLAYVALLAGLLAVTDLEVGWNLDDGAYAVQAKVLDRSDDWAYPYLHADVDPGSRFAPVSHSTVVDSGTYPYVRFPAWIVVLRAARAVFGDVVGLYVPSVLGAAAAAATGGLLARALRPGAFALGFWATALGPLVVHSQALWAHTWLAALGGATALLLVALAREQDRPWQPVVLAGLAAAGCLLRREPLLFAATTSLVAGGLAARAAGPPVRRLARAAWWAGAPAAGALVATLVNQRWAARLAPGAEPADGPGTVDATSLHVGYVEGRFRGALRSLVDGVGSAQAGTVLGVVAVVVALAAGAALASARPRSDGAVLGAVAVALVVLRVAVTPSDLAGLSTAAPLVVVGLAAWRWRDAPVAERVLVLHAAAFLAAILATQYAEGGSRDWGGRFLFPILVPATVLAVVSAARALERSSGRAAAARPPRGPDPRLTAGLLVASLVPTAAGLLAAADLRASNQASTEAALEAGAPTVIRTPRYLTRVSWRELPGRDWLSAEPDQVVEALARLRPGRVEPVAVMGEGADRVVAPGWERQVRSPQLVVFVPT